MVTLLLALSALAAPTHTARWQELPQHDEAVTRTPMLPGEARLLPSRAGAPLRLLCEDEQPPMRAAIVRGVVVFQEEPVHRDPDGAWRMDASPLRESASDYLIAPADCRVQILRTDADDWTWAIAERRDQPLDEASVATSPVERTALRPAGPHPTGTRPLTGRAPSESLDGRTWARLDEGRTTTVTGPARVVAVLRAVDDLSSPRCVVIDGDETCLGSAPAFQVIAGPQGLERTAVTLDDGRPVGRAMVVRVGLGAGEHTVTLPGRVLARAVTHRDEPWADLPLPEDHIVLPTSQDGHWGTVLTEGGIASWIADTEASGDSEAVRWFPVGDLPDDAVLVEPDRLSFWLEDGRCRLTVDEQTFVTVAVPGVHHLRWIGDALPQARPDLSITGCEAWLRTTGSSEGGRAVVLTRSIRPGDALVAKMDATRPGRLEVYLPAGQEPVTITATGTHGRLRTWRVLPTPGAASRQDLPGQAWTASVPLSLPPETGWTVTASHPVGVRVRQPGEIALDDGPPPEPFAADVPEHPTDVDLRDLSRAIALAPDDTDRATALLRRAQALLQRGEPSLAMSDLALARHLDPARTDHTELAQRLRDAIEIELFGGDRWLPTGLTFVASQGGEVDDLTAAAAARGDALTVATNTPGAEGLRWWRHAIQWGQILDADQRLQAMARVATAEQPDHPALTGLRSLSSWHTITTITGAPRKDEIEWPATPDPRAILWPDAWPPDRSVALPAAWVVRLPPGGPLLLPVRCRTTTAARVPACAVQVVDEKGRELLTADLDPWGTSVEVAVPKGTRRYLRMLGEDVRGEIYWPDNRGPGTWRHAWWAEAGRNLEATVLGPTLVRLEVLDPGKGTVQGTVRVGDDETAVRFDGVGEAWIPVPGEGAQRIQVALDRSAWTRMALRRPREGSPEPLAHRALLAALDSAPDVDTDLDSLPPEPALPAVPLARPVGRPARTWIAEISAGTPEPVLLEPWAEKRGPGAVSTQLGLNARVLPTAWVQGDVTIQQRTDGSTFGLGHAGGDLRLDARQWWTLIGDLHLAAGSFADKGLLSGRALVGVRHLRPLPGALTAEFRATAQANARTGADPTASWPGDRPVLWSRWREQHPLTVDVLGGLRLRRGPWFEGRAAVTLMSNSPRGGQPFEGATAEVRADLAQPGLFVRLRSALETRFPDADRQRATATPLLEARAIVSLWPDVRGALRPWVWARWRPLLTTGAVLVGVEGRWGAPRALDDDRPSRTPMRYVSDWGFHTRSLRDYPAPSPLDAGGDDPRPSDDAMDRTAPEGSP